jgi:hypothetical protein
MEKGLGRRDFFGGAVCIYSLAFLYDFRKSVFASSDRSFGNP